MAPLVSCYRRGCGQDYDPDNNNEDACCHHPGLPFFHDAYKGWACCNKKTINFTEFLNIKGCVVGKHSNEKPPELPKSTVDKDNAHVPIEVNIRQPKSEPSPRPAFDSPLTSMVPIVAESLKQKFNNCPNNDVIHDKAQIDDGIPIGTKCKNGGCATSFEGPQSDTEECVHHPGVPIFHEGMKYWSCCQKRTTDFSAFLQQVGCNKGLHKWKAEVEASNLVKCRWDWHQTAANVIVAIYAKEYNPNRSTVKINPIRLNVQLEFPKDNGAKFDLDMELRGLVNVKESSVQMYGTKVEIKLCKAEPGSWSKLDIPRVVQEKMVVQDTVPVATNDDDDDGIDLDDVEPMPQIGRVNITEVIE